MNLVIHILIFFWTVKFSDRNSINRDAFNYRHFVLNCRYKLKDDRQLAFEQYAAENRIKKYFYIQNKFLIRKNTYIFNTGPDTYSQIKVNNPYHKEKNALAYERLLKVPLTRQIRRDETKILSQLFRENLGRDDIVLEIGAGTGYFSLLIASLVKHLIAIEPAKSMAQQLTEKTTLYQIKNIELHEKYFEEFVPAQDIDHIIAIGVLDYIKNPGVFIERCLSVAKKKFIFTVPHRCLWTLFYKMGALFQHTKIYRYSKEDLNLLFPNSMLQIDDVGLKSSLTRGFSLICMASGSYPQ